MFTGIVEKQSKVKEFSRNNTGVRMVLEKPADWETKLGDSIAVQGACLTISAQDEQTFSFDLMPESLEKTVFGMHDFSIVNLEQATTLQKKLDGHIVSGHIDTIGKVAEIKNKDGVYVIRISFDEEFSSLVIMKGSITIDGVSLTVTGIGDSWCEVSLIPFTLEHTTLGSLEKDSYVNLEFDMIGKYINRYLECHSGLDPESRS